jgi:anthraniloyl-CoA monooxygenase
MRWWHSFPSRLDLPVEQLFISYMTRAGKVSVERFAETAPDVVRAGLAAYAGGQEPDTSHLDEWIVQQPLARAAWTSANRLLDGRTLPQHELKVDLDEPDCTDADALVDLASAAHDDGAAAIVLTCPDDIDAVLTMLEVAERIRRQVGVVVVARAAARHHDHLVAALASGRVDLIDPITLEQEKA